MSISTLLILSSGGLRSLITVAMNVASVQSLPSEPRRIVLLHLRDGRENAPNRLEAFRRQAEHFHVKELIELDLPHLHGEISQRGQTTQGPIPLRRSQVLLTAMAQAMRIGASTLIWPVQLNGDFDGIAQVAEKIVLTRHLAQLETTPSEKVKKKMKPGDYVPELPQVQTPLLELTDRQLVELGNHLSIPWGLAWSCERRSQVPCRVCAPCRRRRTACEAAGIIEEPTVTTRNDSRGASRATANKAAASDD